MDIARTVPRNRDGSLPIDQHRRKAARLRRMALRRAVLSLGKRLRALR